MNATFADIRIDVDALQAVGAALDRPECVLCTAVQGCPQGHALETFRVDVAGLPPVHWNY